MKLKTFVSKRNFEAHLNWIVLYSGPRGPPRNVIARSNGTSAVLVQWHAPGRDLVQGYIEGYYISCRGNISSQARNRTIQGNTTFIGRVGGLQAGKVYWVQVAAFTAAGAGPSSPVVLVTVASPIPSKYQLINSQQNSIDWSRRPSVRPTVCHKFQSYLQ